MKRCSRCTLVVSLVVLAAVSGCTGIHKMRRTENVQTITLDGMREDPSRWKGFYERIGQGGEAILHVPRGRAVPLKVDISLPMLRVVPGDNAVIFKQDVYLYLSSKKVRVSPDGVRWADMKNMKAVKRLFGLKQGHLSIGFAATKEEGSYMLIGVGAGDEGPGAR